MYVAGKEAHMGSADVLALSRLTPFAAQGMNRDKQWLRPRERVGGGYYGVEAHIRLVFTAMALDHDQSGIYTCVRGRSR